MSNRTAFITNTHIVDILGNVIGRDQPIMTISKAIQLALCLEPEVFKDDDVVFFDPFCKAGEILLACAFISCHNKIDSSRVLCDVDTIQKELYESRRYFGLAPDERHHRLSLRTFLGNTNSHDTRHNHTIKNGNYLSEVDGRLDCAMFEKEFSSMLDYIKNVSRKKKIVAVGNPPYQEADGGFGKSAKSIYHYFVETLIQSKSINEFVLVIPARWFGGGKGLDDFRAKMMASKKIRNLRYFKKSNEVFPTVDINGGVCFINYSKDYVGETTFSDGDNGIELDLSELDIITDDPLGYSIIRKIHKRWNQQYIGSFAWPSKPFGLRTNYFEKNKSIDENDKMAIPCLCRNKKIKYVNRKLIVKNADKINTWKVCASAVAGGSKGNRRSTIPLNHIFIVVPGTVTTETYNVIDTFSTEAEAKNLVSYLKTDFARYLLGLRKITQHIPRDRWNWVPYVDVDKKWSDEELYKLFEITKNEQCHIKRKVEEWS